MLHALQHEGLVGDVYLLEEVREGGEDFRDKADLPFLAVTTLHDTQHGRHQLGGHPLQPFNGRSSRPQGRVGREYRCGDEDRVKSVRAFDSREGRTDNLRGGQRHHCTTVALAEKNNARATFWCKKHVAQGKQICEVCRLPPRAPPTLRQTGMRTLALSSNWYNTRGHQTSKNSKTASAWLRRPTSVRLSVFHMVTHPRVRLVGTFARRNGLGPASLLERSASTAPPPLPGGHGRRQGRERRENEIGRAGFKLTARSAGMNSFKPSPGDSCFPVDLGGVRFQAPSLLQGRTAVLQMRARVNYCICFRN